MLNVIILLKWSLGILGEWLKVEVKSPLKIFGRGTIRPIETNLDTTNQDYYSTNYII